nr:PREDICTED: uncharacterized protein C1orf100 homolog isoform X1 [Lepisosteus oculatus]XP_015217929.1 PREDICTED: uncharacterized protein C1orf100 homolog isoform X1 [Lepisosteus oculatus]
MSGPRLAGTFPSCVLPLGPAAPSAGAGRRGRDVGGLYPGQLGRVHTEASCKHRFQPSRPDYTTLPQPPAGDRSPERSFDQWTLQRLLLARQSSRAQAPPTAATAYQEAFGSQSLLSYQDERKYPPHQPLLHLLGSCRGHRRPAGRDSLSASKTTALLSSTGETEREGFDLSVPCLLGLGSCQRRLSKTNVWAIFILSQ